MSIGRLCSVFLLLFLALPGYAQEIQRLDEQGNPIVVDYSNAQFVAGEVIVRFRDGYLDGGKLESNAISFPLSQGIVADAAFKNILLQKGGSQLRRVVTKLRPSHIVSTTRTGRQVPIPDLYNLMV